MSAHTSRLIYVSSPYRATSIAEHEENVRRAERVCRSIVLTEGQNGTIPVAPHLLFPRFLNDDNIKERELGLRIALKLLGHCSELRVYGDCITDGMRAEIAKARRLSIPTKFEEWPWIQA